MDVFLATPTYDGSVVPAFKESLTGSLRLLKEAGIPARWEPHSGCCYLPIARNKLVKKFLESDATDLVFLDADVSWEPEDLLRLLAWPVEMVGGAYRRKDFEESYPVWYRTDGENRPLLAGLSELIECWGVPTGFLRLSRSVFDEVKRHVGENLEVDEFTPDAQLLGGYLNFFDCEKRGRQWWGEDTNFCRRWTIEMGRKLYVDPMIPLTHWGSWPSGHLRPFVGDFHDHLSRLPGGANDPGYQGTDIPGYLSKKEAQWLFARAREMGSVVELGSFVGRSTHALLSGCSGPVTCVDTWLPMDWHDALADVAIEDDQGKADFRYSEFLRNTAEFGNRVVKRMSSLEASRNTRSVDMVWIDGDHSYEAVGADIEAWLPKCRRLICGHDYDQWGWPGVKRAVDLVFGHQVKQVSNCSIWYVEL